MSSFPISALRRGVFCALVALLGTMAHAQILSSGEVDRMERELRRAYTSHDSADFAVFEHLFPKLKTHYQTSGKLQELAWLNHAYGFEEEAARIESEIERTLRLGPIHDMARLDESNGRVHLARWSGGFKGLIVTRERRIFLSSADPTLNALTDKRRYGVAAYYINRILGFRLVPVTTTRQIGNDVVMARAYIADAAPAGKNHLRQPYDNEELHVLDYVMEQIDRNALGLLVRLGGELVAVDNKHALGVNRLGIVAEFGQPARRPPRTISRDARAAVLRLAKVLERNHPADIPGTTAEDYLEMRARVALLLDLPVVSWVQSSCNGNLTN